MEGGPKPPFCLARPAAATTLESATAAGEPRNKRSVLALTSSDQVQTAVAAGSRAPNRRRFTRRRAAALAGLAALAASLGAFVPHPAAAVAVVQASCYDAMYYDGLTTRWSASHCASATTDAGYGGASFDNASAKQATERNARDGVFFFAGHALVFTTQGDSGSTLVFEGPNSSGDLDGLASTPQNTALFERALIQLCSAGGGCRDQNAFLSYPYLAEKVNLVVAEGCNTAQNGSFLTVSVPSFAQGAYNHEAGTAIGFYDEILFPVNADETGQYGDGWANRFWSDLDAGYDYTTAMVDAANAVGNAGGLGSYVEFHHPGAPTHLRPAGVYVP